MAGVIVEVRTLAGPKHSGQFGGAAPDALIALLHALAALHDEHGDVAVPGPAPRGVDRAPRTATRSSASWPRCEPGMPFIGTGGLGERVWSGPALTVTGIDVLPVDKAVNAVVPVRARQAEPAHPSRAGSRGGAGDARAAPRGPAAVRRSRSRSSATETGKGFAARTSGPAYEAASAALASAWGGRP